MSLVFFKEESDGVLGKKIDGIKPDEDSDLGEISLPKTGFIEGVVKKSEEDNIGIEVFIPGTSFSAITNKEGQFTISHVPPGTWEVHTLHDAYESFIWEKVTVKSSSTTTLDRAWIVPASGAQCRLFINEGSKQTTQAEVSLSIYYSKDSILYKVAEEPDFINKEWKPIPKGNPFTISYTLPALGDHTLYLTVQDQNGSQSSPMSADIAYISGSMNNSNDNQSSSTSKEKLEVYIRKPYLALGNTHSCLLTSDGTVKCWGDNRKGQLAHKEGDDYASPKVVTGIYEEVASIDAVGDYTCVLTFQGAIKCWGKVPFEETSSDSLGRENLYLPRLLKGMDSNIRAYTLGNSHLCIRNLAQEIFCMGSNLLGQLGDGTTTTSSSPVKVIDLIENPSQLAIGELHTCILLGVGHATCWGDNQIGQLGIPTVTGTNKAKNINSQKALGITAAGRHTCMYFFYEGISCWGENIHGQLGNGSTTQSNTPVASAVSDSVVQASTSTGHTCALLKSGEIECWGDNSHGQIGVTGGGKVLSPTKVEGLTGSTPKQVATGLNHSCVLYEDESVECWGANANEQLGDGTNNSSYSPVKVNGL